MGARDVVNPWGNELPPVIVIGVSDAEMSADLMADFEESDRELTALQAKWVESGSPWTADDESFLDRMTGL